MVVEAIAATAVATTIAARAVSAVEIRARRDQGARARWGGCGFPQGEFTAIMGPSGSGKSTLLHCMAGLDALTSGAVFIGDTNLTTLSDRQLTMLRRERLGFVFQSFNLVPTLTAAENITLPLRWRSPVDEDGAHIGRGVADRRSSSASPLRVVGWAAARVAAARAMITARS